MRRFALVLLAGACSLVAVSPPALAAQGFSVYEHSTCAMGRAGVTAARPCADGSAIFFNPAGIAGLAGTHLSAGVTFIGAHGSFTDDFLAQQSDLKNPVIPVPNVYLTHQFSPKLNAGLGVYAPYGLQTKWDENTSPGRFIGYFTDIRSIYVQPTIGYEISPKLKFGIGVAYITSRLKLKQRTDLSTQVVPAALAGPAGLPPGTTFGMLGVATGTDFANASLEATGTGFAVNFGAIYKVNDKLSIGGHWLTRKQINYDGHATFTQVPTNLVLPVQWVRSPPARRRQRAAAAVWHGWPALERPGLDLDRDAAPGLARLRLQGERRLVGDGRLALHGLGWFNTVNIDFANPGTPDLALHPQNKDTHGFRFGTEYQYNAKVMLRGGYLYHGAASPDQFVTPLLPEAPRNEFTVGAGIELSPRFHADLAYQYIKQNDRRGTVNLAQGNTGLYKFSANLFGLGLAFTF
jgi:long-chain fatty acid transport protein